MAAGSATGITPEWILYRTESSFATEASNAAFTNIQQNGLTADDFEGFFNGVFFPTANLDFSDVGSVIEFGFFRSFVSLQDFSNASRIDNWTVGIITAEIPEPTSLLLMLGAASVAFAGERDRAKARC